MKTTGYADGKTFRPDDDLCTHFKVVRTEKYLRSTYFVVEPSPETDKIVKAEAKKREAEEEKRQAEAAAVEDRAAKEAAKEAAERKAKQEKREREAEAKEIEAVKAKAEALKMAKAEFSSREWITAIKDLIKRGKTEIAIKRLNYVIKEFPGTSGAKDAAKMLKELSE